MPNRQLLREFLRQVDSIIICNTRNKNTSVCEFCPYHYSYLEKSGEKTTWICDEKRLKNEIRLLFEGFDNILSEK